MNFATAIQTLGEASLVSSSCGKHEEKRLSRHISRFWSAPMMMASVTESIKHFTQISPLQKAVLVTLPVILEGGEWLAKEHEWNETAKVIHTINDHVAEVALLAMAVEAVSKIILGNVVLGSFALSALALTSLVERRMLSAEFNYAWEKYTFWLFMITGLLFGSNERKGLIALGLSMQIGSDWTRNGIYSRESTLDEIEGLKNGSIKLKIDHRHFETVEAPREDDSKVDPHYFSNLFKETLKTKDKEKRSRYQDLMRKELEDYAKYMHRRELLKEDPQKYIHMGLSLIEQAIENNGSRALSKAGLKSMSQDLNLVAKQMEVMLSKDREEGLDDLFVTLVHIGMMGQSCKSDWVGEAYDLKVAHLKDTEAERKWLGDLGVAGRTRLAFQKVREQDFEKLRFELFRRSRTGKKSKASDKATLSEEAWRFEDNLIKNLLGSFWGISAYDVSSKDPDANPTKKPKQSLIHGIIIRAVRRSHFILNEYMEDPASTLLYILSQKNQLMYRDIDQWLEDKVRCSHSHEMTKEEVQQYIYNQGWYSPTPGDKYERYVLEAFLWDQGVLTEI